MSATQTKVALAAIMLLVASFASFFGTEYGIAKTGVTIEKISGQAYLDMIEQKFRKVCFPPVGLGRYAATVRFILERTGKISDIKLIHHIPDLKHPGLNDLADNSMIEGIKNLQPLPQVPHEINCPAAVIMIVDGRVSGPVKIIFKISDALNERLPKVVR